jgi:dihydrolipoamide dehydrogenase
LQKIRQMPNMTFIPGTARFISNSEVEIEEMTGDTSIYAFERAIIATGSAPSIPTFEGDAVHKLLTSELLFKQHALPKSMVIIGGGPIGIEMAQMMTKLDVRCTIVEMMDTILQGVVEPEFIQSLSGILENSGIHVYPSSKVLSISMTGSGFSVLFQDAKGEQQDVRSEQVLVAAGRKPNIEELNLKATEIQFDRRGIIVNDHLQTGVEHIYAVGDVIVGPKFAHTATHEAHITAVNILSGGNVMKEDFSKNSWVLFSDPEIASVGYTQAEAAKDGRDIMTGTYDYKIDSTAQINGHALGYLKFIVDRKTFAIIGIHLCTPGASSIIGEAALIVSKGLTLPDVAQTIHPHPTLTEAFGFLAMNMLMGA